MSWRSDYRYTTEPLLYYGVGGGSWNLNFPSYYVNRLCSTISYLLRILDFFIADMLAYWMFGHLLSATSSDLFADFNDHLLSLFSPCYNFIKLSLRISVREKLSTSLHGYQEAPRLMERSHHWDITKTCCPLMETSHERLFKGIRPTSQNQQKGPLISPKIQYLAMLIIMWRWWGDCVPKSQWTGLWKNNEDLKRWYIICGYPCVGWTLLTKAMLLIHADHGCKQVFAKCTK